jgi:hypothetical protein
MAITSARRDGKTRARFARLARRLHLKAIQTRERADNLMRAADLVSRSIAENSRAAAAFGG